MWLSLIAAWFSLGSEPLTYYADEVWRKSLQRWSLVSILRWEREIVAVVAAIDVDAPPEGMKVQSIMRVLTSQSALFWSQIDLILTVARECFLPLHKVLSLVLPTHTLKRIEHGGQWDIPRLSERKSKQEMRKELLVAFDEKDIVRILSERVLRWKTLILTPNIWYLKRLKKAIPWALTDDMKVLSAPRHALWRSAVSGEINCLIGLRRTLTWWVEPFDHIIYLEDALSPNTTLFLTTVAYRRMLEIMCQSAGKSLTYLSYCPSPALIKEMAWMTEYLSSWRDA